MTKYIGIPIIYLREKETQITILCTVLIHLHSLVTVVSSGILTVLSCIVFIIKANNLTIRDICCSNN